MTVTVASFRGNFPAFASTTTYPDGMVQFWLTWSTYLLDPDRWGDLLDLGTQLLMAHNLILEGQSNKAAGANQTPGQIIGAVTAGSVDKVSFSRDISQVMEPNAGHWNLTTYGMRYIHFVRMVGAGPLQIGIPSDSDFALTAWAGPWTFNYPNPNG